ncbi:MAG: alpha-amylase family glycosyl hydrolase [Egibacteraceae bacterium]
MCEHPAEDRTAPWWRDAVGYEVYLRSFADGDGDGVGDLPGLLGRLDHLAWLGVDLVWVTPFYPSPMCDHGYDVADYMNVDEVFGSLADLDAVVSRAHELGMRLIVDLVPNHTSSDHPWFQQSRSCLDNVYRDYYVWRDPRPDGGPPNNWVSVFGGPAWTLDQVTGQYWLHLFLPEQPDLNWANPKVADEFDRILRFWLDRGVDGFRIDVAHALAKHPDLPDNPPGHPPEWVESSETSAAGWAQFKHRYDTDQPTVLDVYRRWRGVVEPYRGLLLGEVYLLEADRISRYLAGDGLDLAFWFPPLHLRWDVDKLRWVLREGTRLTNGAVAWVTGSHDRPRAVSRFGGGAVGQARALALSTLEFGLPGVPFLYQGEELGLPDVPIAVIDAQDPVALRERVAGRDPARTPMPWDSSAGPGLGFTTAERAWLPFGDRTPADTAACQRADDRSILHRYRKLIRVRRSLLRGPDSVGWLIDSGPVIAYRRGPAVVAANSAADPERLALPGRFEVRFSSLGRGEGEIHDGVVQLAGNEAMILASTDSRGA